jgi:uncharacterized protein (DUF2062 family)
VTARPDRSATLKDNLRLVWRRLRGGQFTPARFGRSVAAGLFIGSLPLYGLHLPLCALVCLPLRLDLVVSYVAAHISNPFFAPALLVVEVDVGSLLLTGEHAAFDLARAEATGVGGFVLHAVLGSITVGATLAAAGGVAGFLLARALRRRSASGAEPPVEPD